MAGSGTGTTTEQHVQEILQPPPMYRVLMHNDDYTTMDFVVEVLMTVFRKPVDVAIEIMLAIHHAGMGECGVFPAQVAETKIDQVHSMAQNRGFPLRCSMEPE
ncbi:MAG: hypothetical protein AMXMBFR84_38030 [Candidatus Hydrogenedentota bacterium]